MDFSIKKTSAIVVVLAVLAVVVVVVWQGWDSEQVPGGDFEQASSRSAVQGAARKGATTENAELEDADAEGVESEDVGEDAGEESAEEPKTAEELQEEEDEKKVDAFDALTDKWMEKEGGEVTMKDMDDFVAAIKSVPDARKDECLHRALNLVSDDHVLLLAGILFDKSIDKEYLELVFNDVLNRDEEVKKLILPKIFKDKEHPCWADTAWILDVTGELPKKEKSE